MHYFSAFRTKSGHCARRRPRPLTASAADISEAGGSRPGPRMRPLLQFVGCGIGKAAFRH